MTCKFLFQAQNTTLSLRCSRAIRLSGSSGFYVWFGRHHPTAAAGIGSERNRFASLLAWPCIARESLVLHFTSLPPTILRFMLEVISYEMSKKGFMIRKIFVHC